jgi:hypothetical protein
MFERPNNRAITLSIRRLVDLAAASEAKIDARLVAGQRKNGQSNGPFGSVDADRQRDIVLVMDVVMNSAAQPATKSRDSD